MEATFASWSSCLVPFFLLFPFWSKRINLFSSRNGKIEDFSRTGDLIIDGKCITSEYTFRRTITYTNLVLNEWSSVIWRELMQYDYWQYLANGVYHLIWKVIPLLYKILILSPSYHKIFKLSLDKAHWNSLRPEA